MIIAITGGPRTGKTTLAHELALISGTEVLSTDSFMDLGWSECSQYVADLLLTRTVDLIVEGVAVPRVLRKMRPFAGAPISKLFVLRDPRTPLTAGQLTMTKGVHSVLQEISPYLRYHRVEVEYR